MTFTPAYRNILAGSGGTSQTTINPAALAASNAAAKAAEDAIKKQQEAALANVDLEAENELAAQNQTASARAAQVAQAMATASRPVGGGIYQRRGVSIGEATGGLAKASIEARKAAKKKAALASLAADPATLELQTKLAQQKAITGGLNPRTGRPMQFRNGQPIG